MAVGYNFLERLHLSRDELTLSFFDEGGRSGLLNNGTIRFRCDRFKSMTLFSTIGTLKSLREFSQDLVVVILSFNYNSYSYKFYLMFINFFLYNCLFLGLSARARRHQFQM